MVSFLKEAAQVRPTQKQLDWFDMEMYAFVHFSPNTFTDLEWGNGDEPESIFDPKKLDCDQWVEAVKSAGMKGLVLTAKHHDGFCLWPTRTTEHSVKNSPLGRDVVREAAEACRRGGIKFGFYLSPWDRNAPCYGTPAYNDFFCEQLTELLTGYGDIFYVWFDNACGEGPNGKKQEYDFPRYFELIRKYQPGAVIFNDFGPDVRWCGNEAGTARYAEWAVVPTELCHYAQAQTGPGPLAGEGDLSYLYNTAQEIGAMPNILYSKGLAFVPAEIDMSIRPGWFWHPHEEPHSLERLFRTYLDSVGNNACFHLNIPPNREGLFDSRDVARLKEFGELVQRELGTPLPVQVEQVPGCPATQARYTAAFPQPQRDVKYVVLQEDLTQGQRVESFRIVGEFASGREYVLFQGTCIGHKRICRLKDPYEGQNPLTIDGNPYLRRLQVHITAARDEVALKNIQVF